MIAASAFAKDYLARSERIGDPQLIVDDLPVL
jgi:hypothetical protein